MDNNYRIVKTETANYFNRGTDNRYHIEKKFVFWWVRAMTPAIYYIRSASSPGIKKVCMSFDTLQKCEDHLNKYFKSELTQVYKGYRIKKHYNYEKGYDTLVNLDHDFGARNVIYQPRFACKDINEHKRLIDYWISKTKKSIIS